VELLAEDLADPIKVGVLTDTLFALDNNCSARFEPRLLDLEGNPLLNLIEDLGVVVGNQPENLVVCREVARLGFIGKATPEIEASCGSLLLGTEDHLVLLPFVGIHKPFANKLTSIRKTIVFLVLHYVGLGELHPLRTIRLNPNEAGRITELEVSHTFVPRLFPRLLLLTLLTLVIQFPLNRRLQRLECKANGVSRLQGNLLFDLTQNPLGELGLTLLLPHQTSIVNENIERTTPLPQRPIDREKNLAFLGLEDLRQSLAHRVGLVLEPLQDIGVLRPDILHQATNLRIQLAGQEGCQAFGRAPEENGQNLLLGFPAFNPQRVHQVIQHLLASLDLLLQGTAVQTFAFAPLDHQSGLGVHDIDIPILLLGQSRTNLTRKGLQPETTLGTEATERQTGRTEMLPQLVDDLDLIDVLALLHLPTQLLAFLLGNIGVRLDLTGKFKVKHLQLLNLIQSLREGQSRCHSLLCIVREKSLNDFYEEAATSPSATPLLAAYLAR
jgi:hypothetical protein